MSDQLNSLEIWTLARAAAGYDLNPLPYGLSPRIETLTRQLLAVNFRDREYLLKRNLTAKESQDILALDTESPQPLPALDDDQMWLIVRASELKFAPPIEWLVPGEIMDKGLTIIYGESGAGKSFVGLDYALRVAQDHNAVYIPTEGEAGYAKRVAAWCQHHKSNEGKLFFIFGSISLFDRDLFEKLLIDLAQIQPRLIIVDTLAMALAGGDENSTRDMGVLLRSCRRIIRALGASVVLVHHVNKGGVVERGSGALRGNADIMIKVSPADDLVLVECAKTKDEKPFEPRYVFLRPVQTELGESLVPVPGEMLLRDKDTLSVTQKRLLDVLALEVNRDGVSVRDLELQTGISVGTCVRTLSNLLTKELVHKPYGSYAITDKGLKAIGKSDSTDSQTDSQNKPNLADDPTDSLIHAQNGKSESHPTESRESLESVNQSGSLFNLETIATKPANQYKYEVR